MSNIQFSNIYIYSGHHILRNVFYDEKGYHTTFQEVFASSPRNQLHIDVLLDKNWAQIYSWKQHECLPHHHIHHHVTEGNSKRLKHVETKEKKWQRDIIEAIPYHGDPHYLEQLLVSLIDKYTEKCAHFHIGTQSKDQQLKFKTLVIHLPSIEFMPIYQLCIHLIEYCILKYQIGMTLIIERCYSERRTRRGFDWSAISLHLNENHALKKSLYQRFVTIKWLVSPFFPWFATQPLSIGTIHTFKPNTSHFEDEDFQERFLLERLSCSTFSYHQHHHNECHNQHHIDLHKTGDKFEVKEDKYACEQQTLHVNKKQSLLTHIKDEGDQIKDLSDIRQYRLSLCKLRILLSGHEAQHMNQKSLVQNLFHILNGMFIGLASDKRIVENRSKRLPLFLRKYTSGLDFVGYAIITHIDIQNMHVYIRTNLELEGDGRVNTLFLSHTCAAPPKLDRFIAKCSNSDSWENITLQSNEVLPDLDSQFDEPYYSTALPKEPHLAYAIDETRFRDIGSYGGTHSNAKTGSAIRKHSILQRIGSHTWS